MDRRFISKMKFFLILIFCAIEAAKSYIINEEFFVNECYYEIINIYQDLQQMTNVDCSIYNKSIKSPNDLELRLHENYLTIVIKRKNFENLTEPILKNFSVNQLDLSNNQIRYISRETFSSIKNIKKLKLTDNCLTLLSIYNIYVKTLPDSFIALDLNENMLFSLTMVFGENFANVNKLSLNSAKIKKTLDFNFAQMRNLTELDLSFNEIETINELTFYGLDNLQTLDLSFNRLTIINRNSFMSLSSLKILDLDNNFLEEITSNAFVKENNQLEILYMNNNQFNECSKLGLNHLSNLNELELGYNYLKSPNCSAVLGQLDKLENLLLTFNQLQSIKFTNKLNNMLCLKLDYLNLSSFDVEMLSHNVQKLYIDHNKIQELKFNVLSSDLL